MRKDDKTRLDTLSIHAGYAPDPATASGTAAGFYTIVTSAKAGDLSRLSTGLESIEDILGDNNRVLALA